MMFYVLLFLAILSNWMSLVATFNCVVNKSMESNYLVLNYTLSAFLVTLTVGAFRSDI